ncbi:MAG: amidohydrolase family protein [Clostridiales bacterium]|nr:amidohydrolase family protein [Clostridiales bacterium]
MDFNEKYTLTNITIVDGSEKKPMSNMFMCISNRRIEKIGSMERFEPKEGYTTYDYSNHYVMPGLIDAHVHMAGGRGEGLWGDTEILCEPKEVRAMRSVYEAQKLLKHGFTTVRDISWNGLYLKRIFEDGTMPGPHVIACGPGLARSGGHCDSPQFPLEFVKENHFWAIISDGVDECRRNVRRVLRLGADQVKFWATGGGNWDTDRITDTHYSLEEMKVICAEAHMIKGTMVCAHCETEESIRMAIEAGADTVEHGEDLTPELAQLMAEKGIILVPTIFLIANWYDMIPNFAEGVSPMLVRPDPFLQRTLGDMPTQEEKDNYKSQVLNSFRIAREYGVKIALGSDTVYEPSCEYGQQSLDEFSELVKCGMSVSEAIQAATANAAAACGMDHRLGTLEAGKFADMIILEKDPTRDVKVISDRNNFKHIIIGGRIYVDEGRLAW